jgi:hypothetical protein
MRTLGTGQQIYGCNLHVAHDLHEEEAITEAGLPYRKIVVEL